MVEKTNDVIYSVNVRTASNQICLNRRFCLLPWGRGNVMTMVNLEILLPLLPLLLPLMPLLLPLMSMLLACCLGYWYHSCVSSIESMLVRSYKRSVLNIKIKDGACYRTEQSSLRQGTCLYNRVDRSIDTSVLVPPNPSLPSGPVRPSPPTVPGPSTIGLSVHPSLPCMVPLLHGRSVGPSFTHHRGSWSLRVHHHPVSYPCIFTIGSPLTPPDPLSFSLYRVSITTRPISPWSVWGPSFSVSVSRKYFFIVVRSVWSEWSHVPPPTHPTTDWTSLLRSSSSLIIN